MLPSTLVSAEIIDCYSCKIIYLFCLLCCFLENASTGRRVGDKVERGRGGGGNQVERERWGECKFQGRNCGEGRISE